MEKYIYNVVRSIFSRTTPIAQIMLATMDYNNAKALITDYAEKFIEKYPVYSKEMITGAKDSKFMCRLVSEGHHDIVLSIVRTRICDDKRTGE